MRIPGTALAAAAACVLSLAAGCAAGAPRPVPHPGGSELAAYPPGPLYYVSLGDSLSQGVQPDAAGASLPTDKGYPNRIYSALRARDHHWRLVKLGCSGETTKTMIHGGLCDYPAGSQLGQAERILRAHRGHIDLITIDIGANDPNTCIYGAVPLSKIMSCMGDSIVQTTADLRTIMGGLRAAAGPGVTIIAMNYYVPELAGWFDGLAGQEIAVLTERLVVGYNKLLAAVYRHYGARIADVFAAFHSSDFGTKVRLAGRGLLPTNVATICEWTWACAPPPRGPNEHANVTGYDVIAKAFLAADPRLAG
jgi:lysophospholipase L1-like esterase